MSGYRQPVRAHCRSEVLLFCVPTGDATATIGMAGGEKRNKTDHQPGNRHRISGFGSSISGQRSNRLIPIGIRCQARLRAETGPGIPWPG
jgi:hypothetical protein